MLQISYAATPVKSEIVPSYASPLRAPFFMDSLVPRAELRWTCACVQGRASAMGIAFHLSFEMVERDRYHMARAGDGCGVPFRLAQSVECR